MSQLSTRLTLRQRLQVGALVCTGILVLAVAAVAVRAVRPTGAVAGPVLTLQAPVTELDRDRADAAIMVRNAIDRIERAGLDVHHRGGHRDTGRGWFLRRDEGTYNESIADVLLSLGLVESDDADVLENTLVHQCGDFFAVLTPSTVLAAPEDLARWEQSDCQSSESLVRDGPVFVVLSEQTAAS